MGYQESFIFTNKSSDVQSLIEIFKKYDVRTKDDSTCNCVGHVTFLKNTNKQALWVVGERSAQRNKWRLVDCDSWQETKQKLDAAEYEVVKGVKIRFCDYLPMQEIMNNSSFAKIDPIQIEAEVPENIEMIKAFVEDIMPAENFIENNYDGVVFSDEDFQICNERILQSCSKHGIQLNIQSGKWDNKKCWEYSLEDRFFGSWIETPHLIKNGSWDFDFSEQNLRYLARALSKAENKPISI